MIVFTRSSTLAILIIPPVIGDLASPGPYYGRVAPQDSLPILCKLQCRVNLRRSILQQFSHVRPRLLVFEQGIFLAHVQAAVDVQDLAGDVAGFVAGEENNRGGDVAVAAKAAERDHRLHLVFQFR